VNRVAMNREVFLLRS